MSDEPHRYLDEDTTDEYLDVPVPVYAPDGKPASGEEVDLLLERAKRGEVELPKLPKLPKLPER